MKFLTTALLILGFAGLAHAEQNDSRFYLGSGAGLYYVDFDDIDYDEGAATVRGFVGFNLNQYLSFEAGYTNLFEVSDDILGIGVDIDGRVIDVSVRPTLPVTDNFRAFGILGYSHFDFEITASAPGINVSDSSDGEELHYGIGAEMDVSDNWSLRGEWVVADVEDADFGIFSVSASYNFR